VLQPFGVVNDETSRNSYILNPAAVLAFDIGHEPYNPLIPAPSIGGKTQIKNAMFGFKLHWTTKPLIFSLIPVLGFYFWYSNRK
jgi:hypothetical protein